MSMSNAVPWERGEFGIDLWCPVSVSQPLVPRGERVLAPLPGVLQAYCSRMPQDLKDWLVLLDFLGSGDSRPSYCVPLDLGSNVSFLFHRDA